MQHGTQFLQKLEKNFKVTGISNEVEGSEDFIVIDNERENNDNGNKRSISSDSEMIQTC
jgi:hypothetical protein